MKCRIRKKKGVRTISFLRRRKPVNTKMTKCHSVELIKYQMRSLIQNNCTCTLLITRHQYIKGCQHFPLFQLVIFLTICQGWPLRKRPPREKYFKLKKSLTPFCSLLPNKMFWPNFLEISSNLHILLIRLKRRHLLENEVGVFGL